MYTMEVRVLCETLAGRTTQEPASQVKDVINAAIPKIFNFDYPIFDKTYKSVLEYKIIRHFYLREICDTPWARWQLMLEDRLNMLMPYYNKLYESEKLAFNPLFDVDLTTKHTKEADTKEALDETQVNTRDKTRNLKDDKTRNLTDEKNRSNTLDGTMTSRVNTNFDGQDDFDSDTTHNIHGTNSNQETFSDTPQNDLGGVIDGKYLTTATINEGKNSSDDASNTSGYTKSHSNTSQETNNTNKDTTIETSKDTVNETVGNVVSETETENENRSKKNANTINSTEDYVENVTGKSAGASYAKMLMEFRDSFINIDQMLIKELETLFFPFYGGEY